MWNYRVVRTKEKQYDSYQLYEVYYDDDGKIKGMTENAMKPYGESVEELQNDLEYMMEALKQPVLDMKELEKQFEENPPWAELVAGIESIQTRKEIGKKELIMDEKELNKKVEDLEHQGQRLQFQIRSLKGQSQQIRKQAEEIEEWIRQQQDPSHNQW